MTNLSEAPEVDSNVLTAATSRRLARNVVAVTATNLLLNLIAAATMILIARWFGIVASGQYATVVSVAGLIDTIGAMGLRESLLRKLAVSREGAASFIGTSAALRLGYSAVAYAVAVIVTVVSYHDATLTDLMYFAGGAVFLKTLAEFFLAYFYAIERMEFVAVLRFIYAVLTITAVWAAAVATGSLKMVAVALFVVGLLVAASTAVIVIRETGVAFRRALVGTVTREAAPFAANLIFYFAYIRVGTILLSVQKGPYEVGLYDAALKVMVMLSVIPQILTTAVYPLLFRLGADDSRIADHKNVSDLVLRILALVGFPLSAFVMIDAPSIVRIVYGAKFAPAAPLLSIMSVFLALQCLSYPLGDKLTTANQQGRRSRIAAAVTAITAVFGAVAIHFGGVYGAAVMAIVAELLFVVLYAYYVQRHLHDLHVVSLSVKQLAGAIAAGAALYALNEAGFRNIVLHACAAAAVYMSALAVTRFFSETDRRLLLRLVTPHD